LLLILYSSQAEQETGNRILASRFPISCFKPRLSELSSLDFRQWPSANPSSQPSSSSSALSPLLFPIFLFQAEALRTEFLGFPAMVSGQSVVPTIIFLLCLVFTAVSHSIIQLAFGDRKIRIDDDLYCDSWRLSVDTNNAEYWSTVLARCERFVKHYMPATMDDDGCRCRNSSNLRPS
jgi:hypothetical protein